MKILLIGEFSGVHNNLKKGLKQQGHDVFLVADGDGFKNFDTDFQLIRFKGKYFGRLSNLLYLIFNIKRLVGYDVVQFISPFILPIYLYKLGILSYIMKNNGSVIYYACGTDPVFVSNRNVLKYHPFDSGKYYSLQRMNYFNWFIKRIDIIIPSSFDYYIGYSGHKNLYNTILLPGQGEYSQEINFVKGRISILFGITRRDFKGVDYIEPALDMIKKKYGNRVDIKIVERLPFTEYLSLLVKTDILIDQCKSYFYGMNAIFAMEKGVIVLSGAEKEALDHVDIEDIPVVNITPNIDDIFTKLEEIINLKASEINKKKYLSKEYVKKRHDPILIAMKFEKMYQEITIKKKLQDSFYQ